MNTHTFRATPQLALTLAVSITVAACQTNGQIALNSESVVAAVPKYEEYIGPGDKIPIDSIVDIDGRNVNLAAPDKRKLVILFATWCKDSNRALKALNASEILNDDTIVVIAIAREEAGETVIAWRDENGIKTPLAADLDRSIYSQFAAAGVPRFITVSADNRVIKMNLVEVDDPLSLIEWQ